jgi:pyroglutamyl-peptidase
MATKTLLLTAFDAFGGQALNASLLALQGVDPARVPDAKVVKAVLPCVFGEATETLKREIRRHRPDAVICAGQAGGRRGFSLERVAINVDDASIPDNAGARPIDRRIAARGPTAYWSTLPIKAIVAALEAEGLPAEVSQTAGTFVCNHVFYGLMRSLARRRGVRGGFVHVPYLREQAAAIAGGAPSLPLADVVRGLEISARVTLTCE